MSICINNGPLKADGASAVGIPPDQGSGGNAPQPRAVGGF